MLYISLHCDVSIETVAEKSKLIFAASVFHFSHNTHLCA